MSEQKIWVEKIPKNCWECPCTHEDFAECNWCQAFDNGLLTFIPDEIYLKERLENCPLIDIKTHDRELVKEVCEKIRTMAHKVGKLVFCEHCYKTNSARAIDEHLLNEILGQIESEFEQKEYEK